MFSRVMIQDYQMHSSRLQYQWVRLEILSHRLDVLMLSKFIVNRQECSIHFSAINKINSFEFCFCREFKL